MRTNWDIIKVTIRHWLDKCDCWTSLLPERCWKLDHGSIVLFCRAGCRALIKPRADVCAR